MTFILLLPFLNKRN